VNSYARLGHTRTAIAGAGATSTDDATILRWQLAASREIEKHLAGRHFYTKTATMYFDGDGPILYLPPPLDLLEITTLKVDADGDGVYETTVTDYWLIPTNGTPKSCIELKSGSFPSLRNAVEIVGKWGYSDESEVTGLTGTVADGTSTTLTASADATDLIYAGDTLLIEDEQIYVTEVNAATLTVTRGVNGTTATAHAAVAISVRTYPQDIMTACVVRAADLFRGAHTGFSGQVSGGEFGGFSSNTAYAQFMGLIRNYKRVTF